MSEVRDVIINLQSDIEDINFFYYRVHGSGRLYRRLDIVTPETTYHLRGKSIQQFFKYLPLSYSDTIHIKDYKERNQKIMEAINNTDKNLSFSVVMDKNDVIRVTSTDYIPIPHNIVLSAIEEGLGNSNILFDREISYDKGMYAVWTTNLTTNNFKFRIWAYNYNDGQHGLQIGTGALILVCSNGLMRYKGYEKLRIVHRKEIEKVKQKIMEFVDRSISEYMDLDDLIERSKGIEINKEKAKELLRRLNIPKWVRDMLLYNKIWRNAKVTLWQLSQLITEIATHEENLTQRYRLELQKFGGRVIEDRKILKEVSI